MPDNLPPCTNLHWCTVLQVNHPGQSQNQRMSHTHPCEAMDQNSCTHNGKTHFSVFHMVSRGGDTQSKKKKDKLEILEDTPIGNERLDRPTVKLS